MIMQTPRRRLFSLPIHLHNVVLDHHLHTRFPLKCLSLTRVLSFLYPSRCFGTQTRGAHNLSSRYKSLESNLLSRHLPRQVDGGKECDLAPGGQLISSEPSQKPLLDTGVSPLQMERIVIKGKSILRPKSIIFHGIPIPPKPPPPASDGMFPLKVVCALRPGHITPRIGELIF